MIDNGFMANVETYNSREQFIFFILKGLANNMNNASMVDTETIADIMGLSSHSKNRLAMQNTLVSLEEKKLLLLYKDLMLTQPISAKDMKTTKLYYGKLVDVRGEHGFTKISYKVLHKFVGLKEKYKDLMFSIYFNIIQRIYDTDKSLDYSYATIETVEVETGINRKTIMKYLSIMKENKIIYYETISENSKKDKNYYSRWEDRQELINFLHPPSEI